MTDWALVLVIVIANDLVIAAILIGYNASRFYDLNRRCAERIEQANAEVTASRDMVKRTEMQSRILNSTHVGRLIGKEEV